MPAFESGNGPASHTTSPASTLRLTSTWPLKSLKCATHADSSSSSLSAPGRIAPTPSEYAPGNSGCSVAEVSPVLGLPPSPIGSRSWRASAPTATSRPPARTQRPRSCASATDGAFWNGPAAITVECGGSVSKVLRIVGFSPSSCRYV